MFREIRAFFCVVAGVMIAGLGVLAMIGKPSSEAGCAILLGAACVWWGRKLMYATQEDLEVAQTAQTNVSQKIERAMLSVQVGDAKLQNHLNRNHLWLTLAIVAINAIVFYMVNVKHGFGCGDSMEGANETGRRAANVVLERAGVSRRVPILAGRKESRAVRLLDIARSVDARATRLFRR